MTPIPTLTFFRRYLRWGPLNTGLESKINSSIQGHQIFGLGQIKVYRFTQIGRKVGSHKTKIRNLGNTFMNFKISTLEKGHPKPSLGSCGYFFGSINSDGKWYQDKCENKYKHLICQKQREGVDPKPPPTFPPHPGQFQNFQFLDFQPFYFRWMSWK